MANEYYDHTTFPANGATGSALAMRTELDAIEAGFNLLPTLAANGGKVVVVNAGATALEATDTPTIALETAIAPTLLNSWAIDVQAVGYWKDAFGVVHLQGTVAGGSLGTVIFTLPAGYRPAASRAFPISATLGFGAIVVATSGGVTLGAGGTTNVYLDGITFRTT